MGDYDNFDDDDMRRPRQRDGQTSAGLIGFIFAMVSVGLLAIVGVLWLFLYQEEQLQPNADAHRWLMIWFLFLNSLSFVSAMIAIVLAAPPGLTPTNNLHRGYSLWALILGIVEVLLTIGVGSFTFCCGLVCGL